MKTILKLSLILLIVAFVLPASAQSKSGAKSSDNQKKASLDTKFLFNKDSKRWVFGLQAGTSIFHGDADKLKFGYAGGLNLRYNFSHVLGLRLVGNYGKVFSGLSNPNSFGYTQYDLSSTVIEGQGQLILTLGNISFFERRWKWNIYTIGGVGMVMMNSQVDFERVSAPGEQTSTYKKNHLLFNYGLGVKRNINKSIDIGLEYSMRWLRTDSMDIINAPIHRNRKLDLYSFPQIIVNFKLGKKGNDHLDWVNPINTVYEDIKKLDEKIDQLDKDSDGDGVADRFDKEENTPAGAKVWGSGEAVDLDGDGIPDVNDQEPNTPPGAKVDANTGIAEDEDGDGVPDILDLSPETPAEFMVNHQGIPIMSKDVADQIQVTAQNGVKTNVGGGAGGGGGVSFLPAVFFASNVDEPYPTHLPDLQGIAMAMKNNPNIKLEVIGNADQTNSDEYNLKLAQRRADNVKKILVQFGVDPSRLITKTNGERVPVTTGTNAYALQANRRVQFFVVK